jgi:hypothetical protein
MMQGVEKKVSRFAVALGGFLIFAGIIITGIFLIGFLEVVNYGIIETENIQNIFLGLLLTIGFADLVAGLILWRR